MGLLKQILRSLPGSGYFGRFGSAGGLTTRLNARSKASGDSSAPVARAVSTNLRYSASGVSLGLVGLCAMGGA